MNKLFTPVQIGSTLIKNRIAMAPMNDFHQFFDGNDGMLTQRCIDFYIERAKGEVGLIISAVFKCGEAVTQYRKNGLLIWNIVTKKSQERYAELAKFVHSFGTKIFFQISAGPGRVARGDIIDEGFVPISASDNKAFFRPKVTCRAISIEEVEKLVASFGEAAKVVASAGIDGIEVHGHEGYLIDQFSTSLWNRRKDKYGGDLKGRLTFAVEILRAIKENAGKDYPVIFRYGSKHFLKDTWKSTTRMDEKEVGRDLPESIEMARLLEAAGYDGLHMDTGCYESAYWAHPPMYLPHGFSVDLTQKVKAAVKIPIIAVGKLDVPELAERIVAEGKADMVAIGRGLLAEPHWARKVREKRLDEIKPCISCHEGMYRTESIGQYLTCALNPLCGNESSLAILPAPEKKRVAIVGGGIAGMEAAIVAQMRGHEVSLYEKSGQLGGQLIPASGPDFKDDIKRLLNYYRIKMEKLDVDLHLSTAVTAKMLHELAPDVVIVATGAVPLVPDIRGASGPNVISCLDVYTGAKETGEEVVVIGGGLEGCESALALARKGKKVTIVEMLPKLEPDVHRANRVMLLDMLEDSKVRILTGRQVVEIASAAVTAVGENKQSEKIKCHTVVLAVGMQPEKSLYQGLMGESILTYEIGDCKRPRKILDAVWEANMVASVV